MWTYILIFIKMITPEIDILDTPEKLNNRASKLITQLHQYTFSNLPAILDKIIKDKSWSKLPTEFNNFGEYALNQGVDGLGVDSNEKLWLLRCALDFDDKHIQEWKDVLEMVSQMIKAIPIAERGKIGNSISLKKLANVGDIKNKITYHPSSSQGQDRDILALGKKPGNYLNKIAQGKLTRKQALIKTGLLKEDKISYNKAKSSFNLLDKEQKLEFIDWLKTEKFI